MEDLQDLASYSVRHLERNASIGLLFREIGDVGFPNLVEATIWKSNIASIEGIHRLHAPNLSKLWLSKDYMMKATTGFGASRT